MQISTISHRSLFLLSNYVHGFSAAFAQRLRFPRLKQRTKESFKCEVITYVNNYSLRGTVSISLRVSLRNNGYVNIKNMHCE